MKAKLHFVLSITILFSSFYGLSQSTYWTKTSSYSNQGSRLFSAPTEVFELNEVKFRQVIAKAIDGQHRVIELPSAEGNFETFYIEEKSVFHPALAEKYPQIKSFTGYNSDRSMKAVISISHQGLQGMLLDYHGFSKTFIEKRRGTTNTYHVHKGSTSQNNKSFECQTENLGLVSSGLVQTQLFDDQTLRKFRIAISASGSYTDFHGGTVADALAAINATLTRINEVFETDLGVTLELVPNNDLVIFTDAATDPYTGSLNAQVQSTLSSIIGEENYDVGHLFNVDNDNGNAGFIGSVCIDNRKGSAFASALQPEGDRFDLDFVAHELGHQFGANHTWSFESEGTGVQVEPASGTTIMGYAGIVEGNDVAPFGDDYFHHVSILQIHEYLGTVSCAQTEVLANNPPTITAAVDYTIPRGTAFALSASANDIDAADILTYAWEQIDDGVVVTSTFGPTNPTGANFRSLPPTVDSVRFFPRLSRIVSGELTQVNPAESSAWETVATIERDLNFALTVRDNANGGGQTVSDSIVVSVINSAGPFVVTSQATPETYIGGSVQEVRWDVANTTAPPINVSTVDVLLSIDGGLSFPILLGDDLPNSGVATVQIPNAELDISDARIMVKANDNIFLAINASPFTIQSVSFSMAVDNTEYDVCQPNDVTIPFVFNSVDTFTEEVTFSADVPSGVNATFSIVSTSVDETAVDLQLTNTGGLAVGSYPIEIIGTSATETNRTVVELNVFNGSLNPVVLSFPEDGDLNAPVNPNFSWISDENATAYDIEIAADINFALLLEVASLSATSYQSVDLNPETTYFWRVRSRNDCGIGQFDTVNSFTTSPVNCKLLEAQDLPLEIAVAEPSTITSTISFVEDLRLADLNVQLEVDHTYLEDLVVTLTSPSGTEVTLLSKTCGSSNNINVVFDDDGSPLICSTNPALQGNLQPLGSLASFNGESLVGDWILTIEDTLASDGGELVAFSLDVCVEGVFRPDEDEDGVFDDGDDLCLGTPKGTRVNTSGCAVNAFASNNFTIELQSESCRTSNDGTIRIDALDTSITYLASLVGDATDDSVLFSEEGSFDGLSAGVYTLCIAGEDGVTEYDASCFEIIITEPEPLSVISSLITESGQLSLTLSGAENYTVELNGIATQTTESTLILDLNPGYQVLKVTTPRNCQGVYEEGFFFLNDAVLYPNPVSELLTIRVVDTNVDALVSIFAMDGSLKLQRALKVVNNEIQLSVDELSAGLYFVETTINGQTQNLKMLKQ